ncbi:MAG: 5-formyltetrahydrofolate cyclo-ligase [Bilifractor sp.]|nr:5-formyltetrahydrofolate cyclo-ligase [Lachnospiraceae bacterium]MDY2836855.1 5-formyltetrahydrofolate cyclo-ligase [Bilifractor sp.]
MDKKELRKIVFARRREASDEEVTQKSRAIFAQIRNTAHYRNASSVFCYMDHKHEVMTREFIEQCWRDGKKVAVPKVNGKIMNFYYIEYFGQLAPGIMGILEPITHCPGIVQNADHDENALFIIPGVAFDEKRHRVGYGGGYYDKYQAEHTQHTTIAVAFEFQVFDAVPFDAYDICPRYLVTEDRILQ